MPGRTFTREFKLEIVRQIATGETRPAQLCREHGLADSVLAHWRNEYAEQGEAAFTPRTPLSETATAEARIAELERFCRQLALENAVLKSIAELTKRTNGTGDRGRAIPERHTMIAAVQQTFPKVSLRQLFRWLDVSRSWYYVCPCAAKRCSAT